ncbi:MAG: anthranilate phosphoribosyltransferase [Chloroflexi bacterium]|jgi:anthranilate phosphoribosyltransferase|nr:anthranilate phosphoribosyltransferase [Chloroflexota bacterium]MBT7081139.1 anthranilate phosphoribosyltransferase [Chloroflexota bacterium]MBT7289291.1 anthranilate phosphoribosyltransferase [Chloroflexota bacterium]
MITEAINILVSNKSLSFDQAASAMDQIMSGQATPAQFGAFVVALRIKGETVDEIAGMASVMKDKATPVNVKGDVVDTCGTGGDNSSSFNISTAAAFVAAGAGLKVAKHGNRAMSSKCGSADVLEALGVKIELGADAVTKCIQEVGFGFMFAPMFHPAMKYAGPPRKEIGIRTVFNILGPLTNPARAKSQVIGVASKDIGEKIAHVLHRLGTKHSLVVHGKDGMDEISIGATSLVWNITENGVADPYQVSPGYFGYQSADISLIRGESPQGNADIIKRILAGEKGAHRDVVVMNAAAALVAGNLAADLKSGAVLAEQAIDSGKALEKLNALIKLSQSLG